MNYVISVLLICALGFVIYKNVVAIIHKVKDKKQAVSGQVDLPNENIDKEIDK